MHLVFRWVMVLAVSRGHETGVCAEHWPDSPVEVLGRLPCPPPYPYSFWVFSASGWHGAANEVCYDFRRSLVVVCARPSRF